jgi:hypothetical protein
MASRAAPDKLGAVSALISLALQLVLVAGASIGLAGHRIGAWLMVAAVTGFLLSHLAVGLISYHRTMSRPWPNVQPLMDDDDD